MAAIGLSFHFQVEYEELAQRVEVLEEENTALRAEVDHIRKEYDQLVAQNASLKVLNFVFTCFQLFCLQFASSRNDIAICRRGPGRQQKKKKI